VARIAERAPWNAARLDGQALFPAGSDFPERVDVFLLEPHAAGASAANRTFTREHDFSEATADDRASALRAMLLANSGVSRRL